MKTKDIPADWWPWIEIIQKGFTNLENIVKKGRNKKERLLIALCLSAAKWITGEPFDLKIYYSRCGLCTYDEIYGDGECEICPLVPTEEDEENGYYYCMEKAKDGESMRLYAEALKEFSR